MSDGGIGHDANLLRRVGGGDHRAMRELVERALPRLLPLAQRMLGDRGEAEDVVQETFVRAWRQASHWQPGAARIETWLYRIALNLCHDRLRGRNRPQDNAEDEWIDPAPLPDAQAEQAQRGERIAQALAALPSRQREALVLQFYQGLSNVESAELMDISVDALESLLARARRNLRRLLADADGEPR
ncbi:MAG: RNA polymerase sigma factor [Pseudoxanthomonas sp.]